MPTRVPYTGGSFAGDFNEPTTGPAEPGIAQSAGLRASLLRRSATACDRPACFVVDSGRRHPCRDWPRSVEHHRVHPAAVAASLEFRLRHRALAVALLP